MRVDFVKPRNQVNWSSIATLCNHPLQKLSLLFQQ